MFAKMQPNSPIRIACIIFCLTWLAYSLLIPYVLRHWVPTGDEPHYLLIAQSLVFDHDLDLANDYAGFQMVAQIAISPSGQWLPAHSVGLPVLIALPYYLGGRLAVLLLMTGIASLIAANTFLLAYEFSSDLKTGFLAWLVTAFTPPISIYAYLIYPELIGALLLVWGFRQLRRYYCEKRDLSSWRWFLLGCALAILPWLVMRFLPVASLLGVVAIAILGRRFNVDRSGSFRGACFLLFPVLASALAFLIFQHMMFGSLSPIANYLQAGAKVQEVRIGGILESIPGWLLDRRGGLFWYAPVYLLALPGCLLLRRDNSGGGRLLIAVVVVQLLSLAPIGFWAQWAPPTRYLVFVIPLAGVCVAYALKFIHGRLLVGTSLALLLISLLNQGFTIADPHLAYNKNFSDNQLFLTYARWLPFDVRIALPLFGRASGFKDQRLSATSDAKVSPFIDTLASERGEVVPDSRASYGVATRADAAKVPQDYLLSSINHENAMRGPFTLTAHMRIEAPVRGDGIAATLEVWSNASDGEPPTLIAKRDVLIREFHGGEEYQRFELRFENPLEQPLLLKVHYTALATLYVDHLTLLPGSGGWKPWGLTLLWLILIGLFTVYCYSRSAISVRVPSDRVGRRTIPWWPVWIIAVLLAGWQLYLVAGPETQTYEAEALYRATGTVLPDPDASGGYAVHKRPTDPAGAVVFGPYATFRRGEYRADFRMKLVGRYAAGAVVAGVDVASQRGKRIWTTRVLSGSDWPVAGQYRDFTVTVVLPRETELEFRVFANAETDLWVDSVRIYR